MKNNSWEVNSNYLDYLSKTQRVSILRISLLKRAIIAPPPRLSYLLMNDITEPEFRTFFHIIIELYLALD